MEDIPLLQTTPDKLLIRNKQVEEFLINMLKLNCINNNKKINLLDHTFHKLKLLKSTLTSYKATMENKSSKRSIRKEKNLIEQQIDLVTQKEQLRNQMINS